MGGNINPNCHGRWLNAEAVEYHDRGVTSRCASIWGECEIQVRLMGAFTVRIFLLAVAAPPALV